MYQRFWLENLKKITQCDYRTLWRHNLNGWEIYSIHRYDLCVVYLLNGSAGTLFYDLATRKMPETLCVFTFVHHNWWQLLILWLIVWTSISVNLQWQPVTGSENTLTSTLLLFYCFCIVYFWVWRPIYLILCCITAMFLISFFTGCPPKASQQPGVNKGVSYWTNSLKR